MNRKVPCICLFARMLPVSVAVAAALQIPMHGQSIPVAPSEVTTGSVQQAKLVASDGAPGDKLGTSVAIVGDTAFAGAPGAGGQGAVYVFRPSGVVWTQVGKITAGDGASGDEFGASLSPILTSGEWTVVIGSPGVAAGTGAAYVFTQPSGGAWTQQQKLTASDGVAGDRFGASVSVFSDTAVVGAPTRNNTSNGTRGAAYTFARSGSTWSDTQRILPTPVFPCCTIVRDFGLSLAVTQDSLIVGAPSGENYGGRGNGFVGAVFMFTRVAGVWSQAFAQSGGANGARYGNRVAIEASQAVATHGPLVVVLSRDDASGWSQRALLNPQSLSSSAQSVALSSGAVLAGYATDSATVWTGAASTWFLRETLRPSEATTSLGFGSSVGVSGSVRVVGAPSANNQVGAVYILMAATPEPLVVGFGPGSSGLLQARADAASGFSILSERMLPWPAYNTANGELHMATGDLDGDGLDEVVIGLGRGGDGYMAVLDDAAHGYALLNWIHLPWPEYNAANGTIWPAVGDIDGDGRAEIIAGLGDGGQGFFAIFDDQTTNNSLMTWRRVDWPTYNTARGETRPAVANIDGGAYSEIVIGLGPGGDGWLEVFDDASAGFAHLRWLRVGYTNYNAVNAETFPAAGDLDEDGYDELVVGLGAGSDGWLEIFDDAFNGLVHRGWIQVDWVAYRASNGETHPAVGSVDGDSAPEIVLGLGSFPGQGGWVQIVDDAAHSYTSLGWKNVDRANEYNIGVASFPAIGRLR